MALSQDIKSQFAKAMTPKKEPTETTVNGTFRLINGKEYVQLDGSDILTPVKSTVVADTGDRVKVLLKEHSATVNGNITCPSARSKDLDNMKDEVDEFGNTIKRLDTSIQQQNTSIIQLETNINQHEVTINQHETSIQQQGDTIVSLENDILLQNNQISAIRNDINLQGNKIDQMNDTIKSYDNTITQTNNTIIEVNNKIQSYDNKIEQMGNNIIQFNNTIETQGNTVKELNNRVTEVNNTVQSYNNTFVTMGNDILILNSAFQIVDGKLTGLSEAVIDSLKTGTLNAEYATIDFSNIGEAAVEKLFAESGIIKDLVMSEGRVTGELIGVVIKGDIIEANTIRAESLVIRGENGLYYRLNHTGETLEAQQTDENSLNGQLIIAKSITATKIAVDDLVAFNATIGKFVIGNEAIYSTGKGSIDASTPGIYLGSDGQMCVGDDTNAIKFYKDRDENGDIKLDDNGDPIWRLAIRADTLMFGADGISVEMAMGSITTTIQNSGGSNLLRNSVGYAGTDFWDYDNNAKGISTYQDELMSLSGSKFIITGTQTMKQKYNTEIGSAYMISCKITHKRVGSGGNLKIEIRDSLNNNNNNIVVYDSKDVVSGWMVVALDEPYIATTTQPELVITVGGSDVVEITDLIINNGDTRIWSSYFDELYGSGHRLDGKGLKFYNTRDKQEADYTISGLQLTDNGIPTAGMNSERMFSRTSEVTNSQTIGKLKTVVLDANNVIEYV